MPLSKLEIDAAKKSYGKIREFESIRFTTIVVGFLLIFESFSFGGSLSNQPATGNLLVIHSNFFVFLLVEVLYVIKYRNLRPQYIESLKITTEIEKQHMTELPYGLASEIQKEESAGKRPLLWRLDAFLSRKSGNS